MRTIINSLTTRTSTKAERRFLELLKELHIPFQTKVKIGGREIDFLIGSYAIDIDGHEQDVEKNKMLVNMGYNPIHYNNKDIGTHLKDWIQQIYGRNLILSPTSNDCKSLASADRLN